MEGSRSDSWEITSNTLLMSNKLSVMVKETLQGKMVYLKFIFSIPLFSDMTQSGCFDLVFYDYSNVFEEGIECASVDAINITLTI